MIDGAELRDAGKQREENIVTSRIVSSQNVLHDFVATHCEYSNAAGALQTPVNLHST
jgi:hypothetical protein